MNKKFFTLVSGLLMAGGALFNANAESFKAVTDAPGFDANQYYYVFVGSQEQMSNVQPNAVPSMDANTPGVLDSDSEKGFSHEINASTFWTIKVIKQTVNGTETVVGYQLINALTGKPLSVTVKEDDKNVTYNTINSGAEAILNFAVGDVQTVDPKCYMGSKDAFGDMTTGWHYNLQPVSPIAQTADQLNAILGNGFGLQICKQVVKDGALVADKAPVEYENLAGNVFAGVLKAEAAENGVKLFNGKKQIVLTNQTWGNLGGGTTQEGYKFAYNEDVKAENVKGDVFTITAPATVAGEPLEVVVDVDGVKYELVVTEALEGQFVLTAKKSENEGEAEFTYNETRKNQNTYVKFGLSNMADMSVFAGKVWNIVNAEGVAGPEAKFVPAAQVAKEYPEGQWLWNGTSFVNRESKAELNISGLRTTDKDNVFTNENGTYTFSVAGEPAIDAKNPSLVGYLNGYTEDQLKYNAFVIGAPVVATGDTVYLTETANGMLTYSKDKADAVQFYLTIDGTPTSIANEFVFNKAGVKKTDYVSYTTYSVAEAMTGKKLVYNETNKGYALSSDGEGTTIVFKNKTADTYNIVINGFQNKLYNAFQGAKLAQADALYQFIENDLFVLTPALAEQYVSHVSVNNLDTIKIFRNDDPNYVLYEKGTLLANAKGEALAGFLGMENIQDPTYAEVNAAMLADTAFRANTYRPQYMLALDAVVEDDAWTCPLNPEHNTAEWREEHGGHCADAVKDRAYMQGRYLVVLTDSVKNNAACEYEGYTRLGFVEARHMGDSLIILSTNDTINVARTAEGTNACTFAFKYVDDSREAFIIENEEGNAWLKYHNGVPVMTTEPKEAWVYNLEVLHGQAPTANEEIVASNVVVAAQNGAVVVKGAEGKSVVVSTILGKVVANQVLASDNATIAAPAGVVVVTVDGESFKVVVK